MGEMRGTKTLIMQASTELWRNYASSRARVEEFVLPQKSYALALRAKIRDNR
jgi:hypothetical protein